MDNQLLDRWEEKSLITTTQKEKLAQDWKNYDQDSRGSKFIVSIASIGALLLGLAAIVFVTANWEKIPSILKILLMLAVTVVALFGGYRLKEQLGNFPRMGSALIFLASLLWGATVLVSTQTYQISIPGYWLIFAWLLGTVAIGYVIGSVTSQVLSAALFIIFVGWMLLENTGAEIALAFLYFLPLILYFLGSWHYVLKDGASAGRFLRYTGMGLTIIALGLIAFLAPDLLSNELQEYYNESTNFIITAAILGAALALGGLLTKLINPTRAENPGTELYPLIGIATFATVMVLYPFQSVLYSIIAHGIIIALIILMFKEGYNRQDMSLVNLGTLTLALYIIFLYIDFFYGLLQLSLFLMIGGAVLLIGGFFLERKRREVREKLQV